MYKALIIDDEPLACGLVEEYLEPFSEVEVIAKCHDGYSGLKAYNTHQPDLIFLDIQMPKITGFELLDLLEEPPAIIFTTAFDQYAIKAFEANATDYLLKPFTEERFGQALTKFLNQPHRQKEHSQELREKPELASAQNRLVLKDGAKIFIIPFSQLIRLEADGDYTHIISKQGRFMKKKTLTFYEQALPAAHFVRVHRSHLLNVSHITRIDPYGKNDHRALLHSGDKVPVSRSGYQKLKELLRL